jgi:hypothetical protein
MTMTMTMTDGRWPMSTGSATQRCACRALAWNLNRGSVMSKHNNVNPGQYTIGGRLHPGDDNSEQKRAKAEASIAEHELREQTNREKQRDQD